jgi:hypothetical protein
VTFAGMEFLKLFHVSLPCFFLSIPSELELIQHGDTAAGYVALFACSVQFVLFAGALHGTVSEICGENVHIMHD